MGSIPTAGSSKKVLHPGRKLQRFFPCETVYTFYRYSTARTFDTRASGSGDWPTTPYASTWNKRLFYIIIKKSQASQFVQLSAEVGCPQSTPIHQKTIRRTHTEQIGNKRRLNCGVSCRECFYFSGTSSVHSSCQRWRHERQASGAAGAGRWAESLGKRLHERWEVLCGRHSSRIWVLHSVRVSCVYDYFVNCARSIARWCCWCGFFRKQKPRRTIDDSSFVFQESGRFARFRSSNPKTRTHEIYLRCWFGLFTAKVKNRKSKQINRMKSE